MAAAPNLGSGRNPGQDVVGRRGMCTPAPRGLQARVGDPVSDRGFVGNAASIPSSNPAQALHPVLTVGGHGDSGGVLQGLSPELQARWQCSSQAEVQRPQPEGANQMLNLGHSSNPPVLNPSFLSRSDVAGLAYNSQVAGCASQGFDLIEDQHGEPDILSTEGSSGGSDVASSEVNGEGAS